ncbi:MAG: D-alanyl-D-alanine carboxypeptidase family protein [Hyphomicrobiaceae bacterium]
MWSRLLAVLLFLALASQAASAGPALLFDAKTGDVLYSEEQDQSWHPASLTKLMTAYIAFESLKQGTLKIDDKLVCSQGAFKVSPSKVGLKLGGEIAVDLAIRALVIKSANDMAIMLGEKIAGSEAAFVQMMNAKAKALGMSGTHFANPHGLPDASQRTTARDLAKLTLALIRDFPEHAALFAMPDMTIGKKKLRSHNKLLGHLAGADGMKTGFICDSGYNIVASATRGGTRLIAIVLGEPTAEARNVRAAMLIEHGFETGGWKSFFGTPTLETLPMSDGATANPVNVRKSVEAWACGWRPPKKDKKAVAAASVAVEESEGDAAAALATSSPSLVMPPPEQKPAKR